MYYPQEILEEVRLRNDIVDVIKEYLPLKKQGSSHFGLCPFHNENTPSFSVSADKQLYYCFGCGAAGNVISFIMQVENCDFVEAVQRLADRAGIVLPQAEYSPEDARQERLKERLYEIHSAAGRFFYGKLNSPQGAKALDYVNKRRISVSIQKKFGLGFAPNSRDELYRHLKGMGFTVEEMLASGLVMENKQKNGYHDRFYNRLMFPIFDVKGRCIAFGGRIMESGEPKYLNSPETIIFNKKRNLYGLNFARAERKKEIIIVEGYMDMITIYQAGFKNVAASLGTAFSSEHAMLLKKFVSDIILVFDSDEAGERAALRAIPILSDGGFRVKVLQVPDGKDPDEYIKHNGPLEFGKLLINAVSFMEFQIKCARKKYSLNDLEQKMLFTKEAAGLISNLSSPIERDVYIKQVSEETGISMSAVEEEIYNTDKKRSSDFEKESKQRRVRSYTTGAQIKTESLHNARGVLQAQKNIISICCSNSSICRKLIDIVSPEEFRDKVFCSLLKYVYDCCLSGRNAVPADAVNIFADSESQAKAAEVFSVKFDIEDTEELEKALNEEIKLIKRVYLDYLASNASSIEEIQKVIELKKELGSFEFKL
ncbi:DNA primase [Lachnospiraceae bacterium NSJ-143]|nr:DNA primase [Lachnospiraceae bacterium NSJ-143]